MRPSRAGRENPTRVRLLVCHLLLAAALAADCVSLSPPAAGSACVAPEGLLRWKEPAGETETATLPPHQHEKTIWDPAVDRYRMLSGDARFELRARGKQFLEIFIAVTDEGDRSFSVEVNGKAADTRHLGKPAPARLMPRRRTRRLSLVALVHGPAELRVRTDAPRYGISVVRWTPVRDFEERLVPAWRARAQQLAARPLFEAEGERPAQRRNYLEQLYERLSVSAQSEVRREARIGLARTAYWLAAENHEPRDIERAAVLLEEALRLAPRDRLVRQMVSAFCTGLNTGSGRPMAERAFCRHVEPVNWEIPLPFTPRTAPQWALVQRRLARRMEAITSWWVNERQHPSGELGGEWGDDVEILRSWGPQALGFGSEAAARGLRRLADGLWSSGVLEHGYDRRVSDVEHSAEPTTDTQPLLAALDPDSEEVRARLKLTSECAWNWIARQPDGRWRFRGAWFNCRQIDPKPERALDVHLNMRAMGPALWLAYFRRDKKLVELLARWGESWLEAMRRTDHGKPAGLIPSAVRSRDGEYLIGSGPWDKPEAEWDYYQWSGRSQEAITSLWLALHDLTGEARWLEAVGESFAVLARCEPYGRYCEAIRRTPEAFYEWRRRSADARFDQAMSYSTAASDDTRLERMTRLATEAERRLAHNFDMFTSEVLYTDRVYYAPPVDYQLFLFGGAPPRGERYPSFALSWPPARAEFARAVLEAAPASLRIRMYSFEPTSVTIPVRFWRLEPAKYRWELKDLAGRLLASGELRADRLPLLAEFPLPPAKEVTLSVHRLPG